MLNDTLVKEAVTQDETGEMLSQCIVLIRKIQVLNVHFFVGVLTTFISQSYCQLSIKLGKSFGYSGSCSPMQRRWMEPKKQGKALHQNNWKLASLFCGMFEDSVLVNCSLFQSSQGESLNLSGSVLYQLESSRRIHFPQEW